MKTYNVTLTNQQTGKVVKEYENISKNDIQLIIEINHNYKMNVEDILDGESHELNCDLHISVNE